MRLNKLSKLFPFRRHRGCFFAIYCVVLYKMEVFHVRAKIEDWVKVGQMINGKSINIGGRWVHR